MLGSLPKVATPGEHKERNRKNGRKSRGPRTAAGRLATDLSKVRHGIRYEQPVIPGVENAREWKAHYNALVGSLAPEGSLEHMLAYRIALNYWRLGRLTKAETAAVCLQIEQDNSLLSGNGSGSAERAREALSLFKWWIESGDNESLDQEDALTLLNAWPYEYDQDDELYERQEWTCGALRQVFAEYAQREDKTPEAVLKELRGHLQSAIRTASADARGEQMKAGQEVARNLLPPVDVLDRLIDYERHLCSQIRRDFDRLERFQSLRLGRPVAPPVAVDVTLASSAEPELG